MTARACALSSVPFLQRVINSIGRQAVEKPNGDVRQESNRLQICAKSKRVVNRTG